MVDLGPDASRRDAVRKGDFLAATEAAVARWHGIPAPNAPARRMAAELAALIEAFDALRGALVFEDEPSCFEAALRETMEPSR